MRSCADAAALPLLAIATALAAGCEPPPAVPGAPGGEPTIELLYPEPGQVIALNANCELDEPIVVHIVGIDLVPPRPEDVVDGEGHWHGGPDLTEGFCISADASCVDYDGTVVRTGRRTLQVALQDNAHSPLGPEDQVEVEIVDPAGVDCP